MNVFGFSGISIPLFGGKGVTSADLDSFKDSIALQVKSMINDTIISDSKTYSSEKIENDFIDNNELNDALDGYTDIVYATEAPKSTKSNSWFKIE